MTNEFEPKKKSRSRWLTTFLLIYILVAGAYLRLVGLDWDEEQHLHPDERFLTMVEASLTPVESLGDFFDTAESSLNPHNRGHGFFVYGTLPIFIVRYVADWIGDAGYGQVYLVGRALSALSDLAVVLLVYLVATRLYDRRVGLLGAAFYSVAVLPLQQSHFFTVDTFTNFFAFLTIYFAVEIATINPKSPDQDEENPDRSGSQTRFWSHPLFLPSILFGLTLGMAVASKINVAPVAVVLPVAMGLYLYRLTPTRREYEIGRILLYLILAAFVSLLSFRVFQPYAFSGPGFFGVKPNQLWVENISSIRAQAGGDVDFPPALQWARRPIWFSLQNLVLWGLGLPLGILAWVGFLWMGWRIIKGEWPRHVLLWGWTAIYFVWQSLQWNSTMRYQLPIYPTLVIFAAWAVFALYDSGQQVAGGRRWMKMAAWGIGGIVLILTSLWGFAFTRIYTNPHTRVAASRWMFQNFAGPITLRVKADDQVYAQPMPFPQGTIILDDLPYKTSFVANQSGTLTEIFLPHVRDSGVSGNLLIQVRSAVTEDDLLDVVTLSSNELMQASLRGGDLSIPFDGDQILQVGQSYQLSFELLGDLAEIDLCSPISIHYQAAGETVEQQLSQSPDCMLEFGGTYTLGFMPENEGTLSELTLPKIQIEQPQSDDLKTLSLAVSNLPDGERAAEAQISSTYSVEDDYRGQSFVLELDPAVEIVKGETYYLSFELEGEGGLEFQGTALANESTWDDGLPLRMDGYDPYGGIYQGGLNFEMYWDDNEEKLERFTNTLAQADYVLITSSRQWGTTPRVPERYPLTSTYYRHLLGCPAERTIEWCYTVAQPGMFEGEFGFELLKVFQSNPTIGSFEINDQFAEEAFTVYDHPKVFVFEKTDAYDADKVAELLGSVDLEKVIRVTPRKADTFPGNLMLPSDRLAEQRAGGTWSDLFNPAAAHNRYQVLGVALWYLSVFLLGLITYPLVRFALPGLPDHGYPISRAFGMLILAYLAWLAGSVRIPFSRLTVGVVILLMALLGAWLAYRQREGLRSEWRERRKYFLLIEGLFLAFFLVMLLIRLGNPDLWHPWKGGEKPMDFSYFNAVLKSTSFPPYDPWFAGGYINYYYYGFVLVGVLVKFLGIVPSFAYNLILPTLFAMVSMGAFSIVWNLSGRLRSEQDRPGRSFSSRQLASSISGALAMAVLGNLGVLQMLFQGYRRIVASTEEILTAGFLQKVLWTIQGVFKTFTGSPLPFRLDEWYWNPSRVIGAEHGNPITEFPFFTFLYADLHAHMIALPVALLVVAWALAVVLGKGWTRDGAAPSALRVILSLMLGGLAIGAMYPINLSDIYTYLPLGVVAIGYAGSRYWLRGESDHDEQRSTQNVKRTVLILAGIGSLVLLSYLLYQPYSHWYSQGYSSVSIWGGTRTPVSQYLTHWGLFLFVIASWMVYETVDWMATTPVSALRKLEPYRGLILGGGLMLLFVVLALLIKLPFDSSGENPLPIGLGVHVVWFVLPMAVWAGILLLKPGNSDAKRFVFFLVGTGLMLTLTVEIVSAVGDIGRMNSVFKFYLHAWTFLSVSAAAAMGWLLVNLARWRSNWRYVWQIVFIFLIAVAAMYPLLGSFAKIEDRMTATAPHTLDGMTYMNYATHHDEGAELDFSEDYAAIRWMQDNIQGSPVIIEANQVEYHWGTRYTIYTGLPSVVGWNWHMRQQRTIVPHDWVYERVDGVHEFYETEDVEWAYDFLERFDVSYIVLGQLERAKYAGPGLEKFTMYDGELWTEVYRTGDTSIYEVIGKE